jgi:carbamoyl-phosphate synthase small subunit
MKGYLILEDGHIFEGEFFGEERESIGEVVFNTSITGYQEVLTDPSYYGQIVVMTYPLIGNYGINDEDNQSEKIQVAGFIVHEYVDNYSNHRAKMSLKEFLRKYHIPALSGIDTRKLTLHIRDKGAMRGGIFTSKDGSLEKVLSSPKMEGTNLVEYVSTKEIKTVYRGKKPFIAVYDFGIKKKILEYLSTYNYEIRIYPPKYPAQDIIKEKPLFVFFSNGPGDPSAVSYAIQNAKELLDVGYPLFGICLGHQIISLALSLKTYKLKFGHRGANHPVKNLKTNRIDITSQNHGFAVSDENIPKGVEISYINLNDYTVEGLYSKKYRFITQQNHPEAAPGPHDANYIFYEYKEFLKELNIL